MSPFLVAKSLTETLGAGYKVSKMASGDLLLELRAKKQYENVPQLVSFGNIPVTVIPRRTMNTIRGVVSDDIKPCSRVLSTVQYDTGQNLCTMCSQGDDFTKTDKRVADVLTYIHIQRKVIMRQVQEYR